MLIQHIRGLRVEDGLYFCVLHISALAAALRRGELLCPNDIREEWRPIGDLKRHATRLSTPAPTPYVGTLGDYISFAYTPFTRDAFASSRVSEYVKADQYAPTDIAIVITSQDEVYKEKLNPLFSDQSITNRDAIVNGDPRLRDTAPFDRFRERKFMTDRSDPIGARYGAEILFHRSFPLRAATHVVVADAPMVPELAVLSAQKLPRLEIVVRNFFFKRS